MCKKRGSAQQTYANSQDQDDDRGFPDKLAFCSSLLFTLLGVFLCKAILPGDSGPGPGKVNNITQNPLKI